VAWPPPRDRFHPAVASLAHDRFGDEAITCAGHPARALGHGRGSRVDWVVMTSAIDELCASHNRRLPTDARDLATLASAQDDLHQSR
jgi:hypothetical protein